METQPKSLLDIIPGYREAVQRETDIREASFLDVPEYICGVPVLPMSLDHLDRLIAIKSPFVCPGSIPGPTDVALFLWCVSAEYQWAIRAQNALEPWLPVLSRAVLKFKRFLFLRRIRKVNYADAVFAIKTFLDETFQDGGGSSSGFTPSYYSNNSAIVGLLAKSFAWDEARILKMPLKRVFQYLRVNRHMANPKEVFFNPSDKVRGQYLDTLSGRG